MDQQQGQGRPQGPWRFKSATDELVVVHPDAILLAVEPSPIYNHATEPPTLLGPGSTILFMLPTGDRISIMALASSSEVEAMLAERGGWYSFGPVDTTDADA